MCVCGGGCGNNPMDVLYNWSKSLIQNIIDNTAVLFQNWTCLQKAARVSPSLFGGSDGQN